jgi:hypothetical protein
LLPGIFYSCQGYTWRLIPHAATIISIKRERELGEGRVHLEEKKRRYAKETNKYNTSYNPYHYCSYLFFMHKPHIFTSFHTMYC